MGIWTEKRKECIKRVIKTIREIDEYNCTHEDAKMINMHAFENEVMTAFGVGRRTAHEWIADGMAINSTNHEIMIKQEKMIRGLTEKDEDFKIAEKEIEETIKGVRNEMQT